MKPLFKIYDKDGLFITTVSKFDQLEKYQSTI